MDLKEGISPLAKRPNLKISSVMGILFYDSNSYINIVVLK